MGLLTESNHRLIGLQIQDLPFSKYLDISGSIQYNVRIVFHLPLISQLL